MKKNLFLYVIYLIISISFYTLINEPVCAQPKGLYAIENYDDESEGICTPLLSFENKLYFGYGIYSGRTIMQYDGKRISPVLTGYAGTSIAGPLTKHNDEIYFIRSLLFGNSRVVLAKLNRQEGSFTTFTNPPGNSNLKGAPFSYKGQLYNLFEEDFTLTKLARLEGNQLVPLSLPHTNGTLQLPYFSSKHNKWYFHYLANNVAGSIGLIAFDGASFQLLPFPPKFQFGFTPGRIIEHRGKIYTTSTTELGQRPLVLEEGGEFKEVAMPEEQLDVDVDLFEADGKLYGYGRAYWTNNEYQIIRYDDDSLRLLTSPPNTPPYFVYLGTIGNRWVVNPINPPWNIWYADTTSFQLTEAIFPGEKPYNAYPTITQLDDSYYMNLDSLNGLTYLATISKTGSRILHPPHGVHSFRSADDSRPILHHGKLYWVAVDANIGSRLVELTDTIPVKGCPGEALSAIMPPGNTNYQWQAFDGTNFVALPDNVVYSGAQTRQLQIAASINLSNGTLFRCLADGEAGPIYKVVLENKWILGGIQRDWNEVSGWSCGKVPNENTDVVIPHQANIIITSQVTVRNLELMPGAQLVVAPGGNLTVLQ